MVQTTVRPVSTVFLTVLQSRKSFSWEIWKESIREASSSRCYPSMNGFLYLNERPGWWAVMYILDLVEHLSYLMTIAAALASSPLVGSCKKGSVQWYANNVTLPLILLLLSVLQLLQNMIRMSKHSLEAISEGSHPWKWWKDWLQAPQQLSDASSAPHSDHPFQEFPPKISVSSPIQLALQSVHTMVASEFAARNLQYSHLQIRALILKPIETLRSQFFWSDCHELWRRRMRYNDMRSVSLDRHLSVKGVIPLQWKPWQWYCSQYCQIWA